ncbi:MAG: hypothetical protein CEE38_07865 [Planctomycetes bacterium B3_Pla]|nr:MAG: hypothetical protein CEE38_07865 [Planctomycetes bacterium B3_Pla]
MNYENCQSAWVPGFGKRYAIYYQDEPLEVEVWSFVRKGRRRRNQIAPKPIKQLIPFLRHGYPSLGLSNGSNSKKWCSIHRLLYIAFIAPIPTGMLVRHHDDNRLNFRLSNLKAGTYQDNANDAIRNYKLKGKKLGCPALWNRGQVRLMVTLRRCGWSYARIGRLLGSNNKRIHAVFSGKLTTYARWIKQMTP